jgi:peptidoglycan hydrolase CwlO-like protein
MKRFLMALALMAVAGATYVATAPGGLQAAPSPAKLQKEIKALQKQVKSLRTQVKSVKQEADAGLGVSLLCIMHKPVGVDQVGTSTDG